MEIKLFQIFIISLFISVLTISCKKDDDKNPISAPNPVPVDERDKYLGNYIVTDSLFLSGSFASVSTYVLQVTKGNTIKDTLYLNNLINSGDSYLALLAGNFFSIPPQFIYTGNGTFQNNTISYQTSWDILFNKGEGPKQ